MSRSSARRALFALVSGGGIALTSAALLAAPAQADSTSCPAPGASSVAQTGADAACSATSAGGSA
ncbi:protein kinase, partial [Nocardia nova]|nr:protein kinase [Nocardia nova]